MENKEEGENQSERNQPTHTHAHIHIHAQVRCFSSCVSWSLWSLCLLCFWLSIVILQLAGVGWLACCYICINTQTHARRRPIKYVNGAGGSRFSLWVSFSLSPPSFSPPRSYSHTLTHTHTHTHIHKFVSLPLSPYIHSLIHSHR